VGITAGSREVPGRNVCDRRHTYLIITIIVVMEVVLKMMMTMTTTTTTTTTITITTDLHNKNLSNEFCSQFIVRN